MYKEGPLKFIQRTPCWPSFNKETQLSGTQTGQYNNTTPSKISISVLYSELSAGMNIGSLRGWASVNS